ncbi:hypothetical protein TURU_096229 [Turdus rufiventris]|nr:hypothetical protein TURU_096229 [Turdus rufiventris]
MPVLLLLLLAIPEPVLSPNLDCEADQDFVMIKWPCVISLGQNRLLGSEVKVAHPISLEKIWITSHHQQNS